MSWVLSSEGTQPGIVISMTSHLYGQGRVLTVEGPDEVFDLPWLEVLEMTEQRLQANPESHAVFVAHVAAMRQVEGFNGSNTRRLVSNLPLVPGRSEDAKLSAADFRGLRISLNDLAFMANYVLTNADLEQGDSRSEFVCRMRQYA